MPVKGDGPCHVCGEPRVPNYSRCRKCNVEHTKLYRVTQKERLARMADLEERVAELTTANKYLIKRVHDLEAQIIRVSARRDAKQ